MKRIFNTLFLGLMFGAIPAFAQWKPWNDLPPHCSHIIVLRGEEDRTLVKDAKLSVKLLHPGPRVLAATKEALLRLTPLLCRSLRRIAYIYDPEHPSRKGEVKSIGSGDLMRINLAHKRFWEEDLEKRSSQLMLQETIIHEMAHAAETLLATESKDGGPNGYGGLWGLPARTLARKTIDSTRLENGMYNEWRRVHRSLSRHGWAGPYDPTGSCDENDKIPSRYAAPTQIVEAGFMTTYGACNWAEDIATFVEQVYIGPEMAAGIREAGKSEDLRQDTACREMQAHRDRNVPAKLAAVYTKLMFLLDLGLVKEEDVAKCTGPDFGLLNVSGDGFHFFEDGRLKRSFQNKVKAGMGTLGTGGKVFEMIAEGQATFGGKSYPANMKLSLGVGTPVNPIEKVSWPRGVHKFFKAGFLPIGPNKLSLSLDGAKAGSFIATDGYVLVTSSSNKLISGSIFLTKAWRPMAPIPVPQVFNPPLHIRFQLQK